MLEILAAGTACLLAASQPTAGHPPGVRYESIATLVGHPSSRESIASLPESWQAGDPAILLLGWGSIEARAVAAKVALAWGFAVIEWPVESESRPPALLVEAGRDALAAGPTALLTDRNATAQPRLEAVTEDAETLPPSAGTWLRCGVEAVMRSVARLR